MIDDPLSRDAFLRRQDCETSNTCELPLPRLLEAERRELGPKAVEDDGWIRPILLHRVGSVLPIEDVVNDDVEESFSGFELGGWKGGESESGGFEVGVGERGYLVVPPFSIRRLATKFQSEDVTRELPDERDRRLLELRVECRSEESLDRLVEDELLFRSLDSLEEKEETKEERRRVSERETNRDATWG